METLTVEVFLNSIVSTPNAKFMSIVIKDFYLNTPMPCYEYMRLNLSDLSDNVIRQCNLRGKLEKDEYVYT